MRKCLGGAVYHRENQALRDAARPLADVRDARVLLLTFASMRRGALTAEAPGYVTLVSVVEIAWVLSGAYDLDPSQIIAALEGLLRAPEMIVERAEIVWRALRTFGAAKADFADCLIERSAAAAGCARTLTFDVAAAKRCGMVLAN